MIAFSYRIAPLLRRHGSNHVTAGKHIVQIYRARACSGGGVVVVVGFFLLSSSIYRFNSRILIIRFPFTEIALIDKVFLRETTLLATYFAQTLETF